MWSASVTGTLRGSLFTGHANAVSGLQSVRVGSDEPAGHIEPLCDFNQIAGAFGSKVTLLVVLDTAVQNGLRDVADSENTTIERQVDLVVTKVEDKDPIIAGSATDGAVTIDSNIWVAVMAGRPTAMQRWRIRFWRWGSSSIGSSATRAA